ncbi:MAG: aminotransferase class I/II-fold pyridoxal phosphate-dependent enzyme [Planctomycetes bacterium]|nr:aminotransferase class I/II-fold pyridoxal phosphate-dependent enzyme [Planctomycetota bacterium]
MFTPDRFITDRLHAIDASGIRRVFDLAAKLKDPINLSIGQPHFDVPDVVKDAAIDAIRRGMNRYTVTQGAAELFNKVTRVVGEEFPGWKSAGFGTLVTSGVSGGLMLAIMTCVGPGDEVIIPDPYFVMYRHLVTLAGGKAVYVDTYPDFQTTAERIAPHITPRTKMILFNSPSNPTGVVAGEDVCRDLVALAEMHNVLLLSDEIYDEFCYEKVHRADGRMRCPSPASFSPNLLLLRGFSKTYGMTGWRLGYAVGPKAIIEQMTKLQQYSFVCAPSMAQVAGVLALDMDMSQFVEQYRRKRDRVVERLRGAYEVTTPGGAFYAFPKVPDRLGLSASQFVDKAVARGLLIIPGSVFSSRDTHFRISYACDEKMLDRGLDLLLELAKA